MQLCVDGQPFGELFVDECDALELILHFRRECVGIVAQVLPQEWVAVLLCPGVNDELLRCGVERVGCFFECDALFVGFAVVVFCFHFEEVLLAVEVGSYSHLLSVDVSMLVHVVHVVVGRVEVECGIVCYALSVNFLYIILVDSHGEQLMQLLRCCEILGIGSLHELHLLHFC